MSLPTKFGGPSAPPKTADWALGKTFHRLPQPPGPIKAWKAPVQRCSKEESADEVSSKLGGDQTSTKGAEHPTSPIPRRPRRVAPVPRRPQSVCGHSPWSIRPRSAQQVPTKVGGEPAMRGRGCSEGAETLRGGRSWESEDDNSEDWPLPETDAFRRQTSSFQDSIALAKQHGLSMATVKAARDEFREFDVDGRERLTPQQFEAAMRKRCNLSPTQPIPASLRLAALCNADHLSHGEVNFEEFLLWSQSVKFVEATLVTDTKDRRLRQYAREHRLDFVRVERLERIFNSCDTDHSGYIEWSEFRKALHSMLKVKESTDISEAKLLRYWKEADLNSDGRLSFPEFLAWHGAMFPDGKTQ